MSHKKSHNLTKNVILVSHVHKDSMEFGLKYRHVIKLKIHKIKQMKEFYTMFFIVKITPRVFYSKQYSQGAMEN
mgnify:CR=1 FL=1